MSWIMPDVVSFSQLVDASVSSGIIVGSVVVSMPLYESVVS